MFVSLGGDNYIGLFTAVVDRMEQHFASIVLLRRYFILCLNTRTKHCIARSLLLRLTADGL